MRDPLRVQPEDRRQASRYRKANLRIAIRQLERAELYVVALDSLALDDQDVDASVAQLVDHLRALRARLLGLKASA